MGISYFSGFRVDLSKLRTSATGDGWAFNGVTNADPAPTLSYPPTAVCSCSFSPISSLSPQGNAIAEKGVAKTRAGATETGRVDGWLIYDEQAEFVRQGLIKPRSLSLDLDLDS